MPEIVAIADRLIWSDPDSAIILLRSSLEQLPSHDQSGAAVISLTLSKMYNAKRDCDSIAIWSQRALDHFQRMDDQRGVAEVFYQQGFASFCRMEYEQAMKEILEGLQIMESLKDEAGIALGHLRMSRIFHFTSKMAQSAEYGRLAGERFERLRNFPDGWDAWSFAGHGYRMNNDSTQAIECFDKGLEMASRSGIPVIMGLAFNDLAAFYMEFDLYDSAGIYFQKSLDMIDPADKRQVMVIKNGLGQVYLHTGQYQKCIDILSEALAVVKETGDLFFMTEVPEYIAQSYAGLGQYDSAYKYMEMNWRYTDSLFTRNQDEALQDMKSKYESDQKDALIVRQKIERKYGFALFFVVSALAFMIYRRYLAKKKMNTILDQRNKEKDFLLREIHHRVKNNLQILSSLLNLQAEYIKDENALNAITEGRNRVQSMAFIHQQLYSDENVTAVDMQQFLTELCGHLVDSFTTSEKNLEIRQEVLVRNFDIETAIPLGLIVNELITNSIKYAFRQKDWGLMLVKLWKNEHNQLCLRVADDGEGSEAPGAFAGESGFGTDLIKILSQKLKGTIETDTSHGYSTQITFDRYQLLD